MAHADTRQLRSEGTVSVHAHRTEGITGSEGREGANGIGGGIKDGVGGGKVGVNVDGNGDGGEANEGRERERRRRGDEAQETTHEL